MGQATMTVMIQGLNHGEPKLCSLAVSGHSVVLRLSTAPATVTMTGSGQQVMQAACLQGPESGSEAKDFDRWIRDSCFVLIFESPRSKFMLELMFLLC